MDKEINRQIDELNNLWHRILLTSMIDRLEKKNLIKRAISTKDRRSYKLELTEEGRKTQVEHDKFEAEFYARIINSLDTYEEMENSAFPEKARRLGESIK